MSESNAQTHQLLAIQTGLHKLTAEQLEVIRKIGGDFEIQDEHMYDDKSCTMNLPQLARRK